jgi:hypothetical protein
MKNKLTSLIAAVGLLCLAPGIASAGFLTFDFKNEGTIQKDSCGFGCYSIETTGTAYDYTDDVPGTSSWSFSGYMTFLGVPWFVGGTDNGSPTSWSFIDNGSSANNLSGTFSWTFLFGNGMAHYTIDSGSGLFAGASGGGSSLVTIKKWYSDLPEFSEVGTMYVRTEPTRVPEPGMASLFAAGLGLIGFVAYRRRRAQLPLK